MASESPANAPEQRPPRVFLSYSHDSPAHASRVLAFAQQLRRDGVDARIDQDEPFPPQGWPLWCARQILDARFVVLICTETYRQRFLGYEQAGTGRGVKWEGKIIQNILYNDEGSARFIPAVFAREDERFIPEPLQGATRMLLDDCGPAAPGYAVLLRHVTGGKPLLPLPEITPAIEPRSPADASIPTAKVWEEAVKILIQKLDAIHAEQVAHERKSADRHEELVALAVDPIVLRARLEEKIEESFEHKRTELLERKAPPEEIDALYRWRDRATAQLTEAVAFIATQAADPNSPIIKKAGTILEERGVDATLEFLNATLKDERQRRKEEGRQLGEASLMKARLHEARLETSEQESAIRDAIADAPDWWLPQIHLGVFLGDRAQWRSAEQAFEAARRSVPADAEATFLNNLATLYHRTNRLEEAEQLLERAVKIEEKCFGPDHPKIAIPLHNLAALYKDTNRLTEAEPLMKRVTSIFVKSYGPDHPNVATSLNNIASLYRKTNRLAEAERLLVRAWKCDEKTFGPDHPTVAARLHNLTQLYKDTNRLKEAEPLIKRAIHILEKHYGPEHPNVAMSLNNLAQLHQNTNRPAEAEALLVRALKIDEKSFGPDHPNVAMHLNNLAALYLDTNRLEEAERLLVRAWKIDKRSFGSEHPKVATRLNNLASLYHDTNRLPEAERLMKRVTSIFEKSYGPEHPDVATSLNNLAHLYRETKRLPEAEPLVTRHLVIFLLFTRNSGHLHPHLRHAISNYKILLSEMSLSVAGIADRLVAAGREAGYTAEEFAALLQRIE